VKNIYKTAFLVISVIGCTTEIFANDKYSSRIRSYALSPYTQQGYPDTIAQFGSRLTEIESFRRRTAEMALESGKCDTVEFVELSTESTLSRLKFWADCTNGQRIYLTEEEIEKNTKVLTQEEKSWDQSSAMRACREAIKDRALIPSEVDIHNLLGISFYKAPLTHNVVLKMNFDAKNAFGTEIPYTATCHFEPGKVGTIDIERRR